MFPYIEVFGRMIPTYGMCMAAGVMTTCTFACIRAHKKGLSAEDLIIIAASAMLGAITGAKLLYDIVSFGVIGSIKMITAGRINELVSNAGYVFYGGMLGGIIGTYVISLLTGIKTEKYYTSTIPFIPVGHAIGRIGCFLAGCCYGKPSSLPIAVHFPHAVSGLSPETAVIPTQLIEAVLNIAIAIYLFVKYGDRSDSGSILIEYVVLYAVMRFFLEFLRGDSARSGLGVFSTSQWISIMILCAAVFGRIIIRTGKPPASTDSA